METTESTKPLDPAELIKLMTDTTEFLGRMLHFHEDVLFGKHPWLFTPGALVETSLPLYGSRLGIRVQHQFECDEKWVIYPYQKIGALRTLSETKASILEQLADFMETAYYYTVRGSSTLNPLELQQKFNVQRPKYTPGMSGKLYLIEVAQAYEKALLKYAEDN